jgi:hypothetical protein
MTAMKSPLLIAAGVFLAAIASTAVSVPAQAKTMKECAAQWQEMKAANQTGGMKYRDFSKQCMSEGGAPAAEAPPPAQPEASAPPPAAQPGAKPTGGRAAMLTRLRACGAEWRAAKAEGKTAGQTWPKYWSACNKRKKAEGV